jgi:hypothetical protein
MKGGISTVRRIRAYIVLASMVLFCGAGVVEIARLAWR